MDDRGVQWDAFVVYPSPGTSGRKTLPAPYDGGWLSLQCASEIRRLTPIPENWRDLSREELCQLLETAERARRRLPARETKARSTPTP